MVVMVVCITGLGLSAGDEMGLEWLVPHIATRKRGPKGQLG